MVRLVAALLIVSLLIPMGTGTPAATPPGALVAPADNDAPSIRATLELPAASWYNDKDGDKIFDSLIAQFGIEASPTLPVIVTFREGTNAAAATADAQEAARHFEPKYVYEHVGGFAADLDLEQVVKIASLDAVRQIEWSQPGAPELDTATVNFNVDTVQAELGITGDLDGLAEFTGNDTIIAIMDTGFDGTHVDLQGKFVRFIDMTAGGAEVEPYDSGSHGTHVASIAGGLGMGDAAFTGVAPGAAFVGFQISGGDTKANAIASVDWIIEHLDEVPVRVSTISFGFGTTVDGTDALELAMDRLWEAGVIPFKSNGNSGPEKGTVTVPGGARGIMSTGSLHDAGDGGFRISSFSSRGPTADGRVKPDITAPGSNIMAANAGSTDEYVSLSGTSMASPFAAGVAALMISADPTIAPEDVRRILRDTAWDWGVEGEDDDWGAGRIDALRAVQQVLLEEAVRERLPFEALAEFDVAPPGLVWHAHGSLNADLAETYFFVESSDVALGVTVIADGMDSVAGAARVLTVELLGPGPSDLTSTTLDPISRQHTFSITNPAPGEWALRATGFDGGTRLTYDATGMVPENEVAAILPVDSPAYQALLGDGEVSTPAPMLIGFIAVALFAAFRRR